ncbi:MAG: hypothetical protein QXL94_07845 [Candidatus Parvarchaeum sp.]
MTEPTKHDKFDVTKLTGKSTAKQQNFIIDLLSNQDYSPARLHRIENELNIPSSKDKIYPDDWALGLSKQDAAKVIDYLLHNSKRKV